LAADGGIFADHVPRPGSAVYAMTKAAVAGLTRGLATNWVAWDHGQRHPAGSDRDRRISGCGRIRHAMRDRTALAHYGRPEDIASAVAYLASPDAGFITGFSWNVDGDLPLDGHNTGASGGIRTRVDGFAGRPP
jgi:3-oxoacyl-[acyl-carrier protein] reductase